MKDKGPNVYIEFGILQNSDLEVVKRELDLLISYGKLIFVWSKEFSPMQMATWALEQGLKDYIWGYRVKDSTHYSSPDFVIDNSESFVDRFRRQGIPGNIVSKL